MYMKCDPDIDSTPAFPESGQAYGCSSDGADRTDCPVNLSGKERFAYEKREAALHKYEDAVRLYATTDMPVRLIAKECHVAESGLQAHLHRWHRPLMLARYGVALEGRNPEEVKLGSKRGQRHSTRKKYAPAVEACKSTGYIQFSISAIAREFGLNETGLGSQLRMYYPQVLEWREREKARLGITDNCRRGARKEFIEQYAPAVKMYRTSNKTIPEVAEECNVSPNGLSQHLRFYHRRLLVKKEAEREQAKQRRKKGLMSGNGRTRGPLPETVEKYSEALKLYRETDFDVKEIVRRTGISLSGFRFYLREWHRDLMLERRGGEAGGDEDWIDLNQSKRYSKAVANKYAAAIAKLKAGGRTTAAIASEYGFHPEVFRDYLHKHEPELAKGLGMKRDRNGKLTASKAEEKYGEALRLYETTSESLKSIAARLGLVYNSVGGYVRRHYPELIRKHEALVAKEREQETDL